ncbi:MAG: single-stranded DNA-binding protein [Planctomycetaceae bacterium]|jgi:single-strand DNA-binding protein|nr:single-stranded DNA-binding protein [Planctomycetaceae bacterium]
MASFNRVILLGNLTRDPELRYTPTGLAVTDIGLAVNDRRKGQNGEWIDEVTFVDITLWGRTAEVVSEYCSKGKPLLVEGRLKLDSWETDGQKKSKLKVIGEKVQLLGSRDGGGMGSGDGSGPAYRQTSAPQKPQQPTSAGYDSYDQAPIDDDVPF